jgi:hypothetical protein
MKKVRMRYETQIKFHENMCTDSKSTRVHMGIYVQTDIMIL